LLGIVENNTFQLF